MEPFNDPGNFVGVMRRRRVVQVVDRCTEVKRVGRLLQHEVRRADNADDPAFLH
jgi:hypothetical protein